ncbi:Endonuclease V [Glycine max]|nr:Endonuclease V [Glycine max]
MEKKSPEPPEEASQSRDSSRDNQTWITAQNILREKLITEDCFAWKLQAGSKEEEALRYVGGVDISFSKDDPSRACGTLVVLDFHTLQVLYQDFSLVTLQVPYVPGFLAFREAPVLLQLLEKMKRSNNPFYPQVLGWPVILELRPISQQLGLERIVRELLGAEENCSEDFINLVGCSGHIWGVAMRSTQGSIKPIFISIGHKISLQTAIMIVQMTCKYRVPEPIRQADIRSRDYIRKLEANAKVK